MEDPNSTYRTLHYLVKHGKWLPPIVASGVVLAAVLTAIVNGTVWALPVGAGAAAFLYLIMCSYVELVRVIVDMLLPK